MTSVRRVLFTRDFRHFQGGHLKVWDYLQHVAKTPGYEAVIKLINEKKIQKSQIPWRDVRRFDRREGTDVLFLAGLDWATIHPWRRRYRETPVINLIQHVRHADPEDPRSRYLRHPAIRICASQEVSDAIRDHGEVRGPVVTIPYGIDLTSLQLQAGSPHADRPVDLLIAGPKKPQLAALLEERLATAAPVVRALKGFTSRQQFLTEITNSRVALLLPNRKEGFFLPALEAMALGTTVVCPDCIGNRSFCVDGETAWAPEYKREAIIDATLAALGAEESERARRLALASQMAGRHTLERERAAFQEILAQLPDLWAEATSTAAAS